MPWPRSESRQPGYGNGPHYTDINYRGVGPIRVNSSTRMRDVTDGSSNTVLVGERHGFATSARFSDSLFDAQSRVMWGYAYKVGYHMGSAYYRPNQCKVNIDPGLGHYCYHLMSSTHTGGIQVLMMDGSVRFISDNIDSGNPANWDALPDFSDAGARRATYGVWQSICDMREGNVVGEF